MKVRLITTVIFLFAFISGLYSQNMNMTFNGCSLGTDVDQMIRDLVAKGLSVTKEDKESREFDLSGKIGNRNYSFLNILYTPVSRKAYLIVGNFNNEESKKTLKSWQKLLKSLENYSPVSEKEVVLFKDGIGSHRFFLRNSTNGYSYIQEAIEDSKNSKLLFQEAYGETFPEKKDTMNFMGIPFGLNYSDFAKKLYEKGFYLKSIYDGKQYKAFYQRKGWGDYEGIIDAEINRMYSDKDDRVWNVKIIMNCGDSYGNKLPEMEDAYNNKYEKITNKTHKGEIYVVRNSSNEDIGRVSIVGDASNNTIEIIYADTKLANIAAKQFNALVKKTAEEKHKKDSIALYNLANDGRFHFVLNTDGSFITIDNRPYYIVTKKSQTAHKIFSDLLSNATLLYVNPDKVISSVTDKTLIINGMAKDVYKVDLSELQYHYDVYYRLEILIKDGRIRINPPMLTKVGIDSKNRYGSDIDYELSDNNLVLYSDEFRSIVSNLINKTIYAIIYGMKSNNDDNW